MGRGEQLRSVQIRNLSRTALLLVPLAVLAPAAFGESSDRIQYFVDEQGVTHLSNVPADPRYKPLTSNALPASPQNAGSSAPRVVVPAGSLLNEVPRLLPEQEDPGESDATVEREGPVETDSPAMQPPDGVGQGRGLWGRK